MNAEEEIPSAGKWPVDPQEDQPILPSRLWVDGCFDFVHHGHAGAMLQAKQLGTELLVGIHSDEAIMHNKGPTVMTSDERVAAVEACRWSDKPIPHAPYVTYLPWVSHYGCKYVVHGDDITTDSGGQDTYRYVKEAGRYLEVKRTPGISTTDLVGRMLLFSKSHFISDIDKALHSSSNNGIETGNQMVERLTQYSTDSTGKKPWVELYCYNEQSDSSTGSLELLIPGIKPRPDQHILYVDGSFDLFSSGHIEFLKQVVSAEQNQTNHPDSVYIIAGLHSDLTVNQEKGKNYPIMNLYERALCTLQCKYINAVILNAPWTLTTAYLNIFPYGQLKGVYHGPTSIPSGDPYAAAKEMGLYKRIPQHKYAHVDAEQIVQRIMVNRAMYEERQRKKGWKHEGEAELLRKEKEKKAT